MNTILQDSVKIESEIIQNRRYLHENPELSFQEVQTCKFICNSLEKIGVRHRVIAETGVLAEIGTGDRCVALRADIDALPIVEESGVEFSSKNSGVMHACGHDAHTAMLLGAAKILKEREHEINGVVKLLFQPGEEKAPGGATLMIRDGALENPRPEAIFGQHVNPADEIGKVGFTSGAMMASTDELYWTIRGKGGHAAQPHLAADPIAAAALMITSLQNLVSRLSNPFSPAVLSITSIHGGSVTNVIPDVVELQGTLRAMDNSWRTTALEHIRTHSQTIAAQYHCTAEFAPVIGYPSLVNNPEMTEFARESALQLIETSNVVEFEPKMWGEDFAFYAQQIPACFWMLGARSPEKEFSPNLHNPKFVIDERALPIGTALLVNAAMNFLAKK